MTVDRADVGVLLLACGAGLIVAGAWLLAPPLAVVAAGVVVWLLGMRTIR